MAKQNKIMTIDQAIKYKMPFGAYKDQKIIDIMENNEPYVEWVATNVKGTLGTAAKTILEDSRYRKKLGFSRRK